MPSSHRPSSSRPWNESWPPWHASYDEDYRAAGFVPDVVARAAGVPTLLGLVAAGVGVTRLAASSRGLSDARVAFVPLVDDRVSTVVAWRPDDARPLVRALVELAVEPAGANALLPGREWVSRSGP
ncbi:LysR substrate-binding domain-containing protein [Pseudonocardia humida]|uniref:LysR substrate-binding domain-containing protein n=1 Tax=Pseudonocardia humida TaxID=2800819 RepID=A0ABT0ZVV7_9PSEU|nr:LysR substrate-binding domain-containing protein [Pseudonocardia humida]MCO1654798.1 hypothetical protein [Pseudonocardia humida]